MAQVPPDLQAFTKQQFDEAYKRALERKRLFKEYLSRHQVMEKLNDSIEKLFECERLPEDPLGFIAETITGGRSGAAGSAANTASGEKGSVGKGPKPLLGPKLTGGP
ncbi:hypothetical protein HYH03_006691 [Edaphochlamys debaryana]|uniref:Uncharacterized protein n=1 Tax=Edaphochlamys debaryana TaxID=47281 RepID=A0A835Y9Z1_9CHLO|nr:hypothetical protein HYH03_006691 [Edaphochlamys debaryana]|eukprot:KAG2495080.1 hypothetical protein HYH03_006691 [Edaphochlamys debaryana]